MDKTRRCYPWKNITSYATHAIMNMYNTNDIANRASNIDLQSVTRYIWISFVRLFVWRCVNALSNRPLISLRIFVQRIFWYLLSFRLFILNDREAIREPRTNFARRETFSIRFYARDNDSFIIHSSDSRFVTT